MKEGGAPNDLLERLANDASLGLSREDIDSATDPIQFTGRSTEQVDEFLSEVIEPVLAGTQARPAEESEIRV
jgi:adenylosuccinate lyase